MSDTQSPPRIAIVCDWLTNMGGAEAVVLALHEAFPDAPIYTSTFIQESMPLFKNLDVRTTYLQKLPKALRKLHKFFPILRVHAFQKLDLSDYDIIISSSSAEAKQIKKTRPDQIHICYCHTPIRYYWSHYDEYRRNPGYTPFVNFFVRLLMPLLVPPLRRADFRAAQQVDYFIANSSFIQQRIKTYYHRDSIVIHPPVNIHRFQPAQLRSNFYVALGRQVPYKRIDLAVKAATELNLPLKVFGKGPEHHYLQSIAGPTVEFYSDFQGNASNKEVEKALNQAKGFIFPAEEDFGIVQVEALAAGTPVISYGVGGTLDIIKPPKHGIYFQQQTVASVVSALKEFERTNFDIKKLTKQAQYFDKQLFIQKITNFIRDIM